VTQDRQRFGLSRPVWLIGWVSFFTDTASEMVYPLLPLFLTRTLGAGALSLGVIEGIAEAANSVLKIVSGRVADRTGHPKWLMLAGYALSSAVRPLMAMAAAWSHVLAIRFTDRLGKGIRGAPRDAMLAEFAPASQRGRVFGFHRAMDHAGAVLGPLLAAAFLYFYPDDYRTLFALTLIPGIVVVLIILLIPEPAPPPSVPASAFAKASTSALRASADKPADKPQASPPAPHASVPALPASVPAPDASVPAPLRLPLSVILLFALGNASDAFLLLRLSDAGIAAFWIPLLWAALHVVKVAASLAGGELSDRLGRLRLIGAGWLFYAGVYAAFALVDSASWLVATFLAYGIYFGLTEGVEKAWIADLAPRDARGTAFGFYNATIGIGALLASVIFGVVWTRISPDAAFLMGAALALAATGLLYLLFSHEEDPGHQ
jgi:MFS family permease